MELTEHDVQWAKETLNKVELFTACSESELIQLLNGLEKQTYRSGSTILFQGEISSRLCLVEAGKVAIIVRKGKEKNKVAELGPNSFFGEISLLTPRAATATVRAEIDSDIIFLPGEVVQALIKSNPSLADAMRLKIEERLESQKKKPEEKK
ncbi:MAG: cyclic nucleotide-binding domain-containing protein [Endomicrobiales bacterium]